MIGWTHVFSESVMIQCFYLKLLGDARFWSLRPITIDLEWFVGLI